MQRVKAEIRSPVYIAAVFDPKREVRGEFVVGAASIKEGGFRLASCAGDKSARVSCEIEDESTSTRKDVGIESENAAWVR
jgi:hypothetical protein